MNNVTYAGKHGDRLQILDLLRFLAAISVVTYHMTFRPLFLGANEVDRYATLQLFSRYGYLGVELFFLISGFVILWSATGRSAPAFAASRVSRLIPSLWVSIALTSLVLIAFGRAAGIVEPKVIIANMTMVAGYLGLPYVDGVYWTLQAEVKFYVLVFVLILLRQMPRLEYWLMLWVGGLALAYTRFAPGLLKSIVIFPYGSYFVAGSAFFLIWRYGPSMRRMFIVAAALVLSLLCVRHEAAPFMGNDGSAQAIGTAGAVVVAQFALFIMIALRRLELPESNLWFTLGALTYPLYLLHNQIGKLVAGAVVSSVGPAGAMVLGAAVPIALAVVLARTVERTGCSWLRNLLLKNVRRVGLAT